MYMQTVTAQTQYPGKDDQHLLRGFSGDHLPDNLGKARETNIRQCRHGSKAQKSHQQQQQSDHSAAQNASFVQ